MFQVFGFHHSQDSGYAQAIVCTQCSSFSLHPLTVNPGLNGICLEVVGGLGSLLWHHVHVCLQDYTLTVFHARNGRFAHNHVAAFIDEGFHAGFLGEVEQELLYFF